MSSLSSDQEADDSTTMAQMMGFTAFGSQAPASKKRRYNPRADAMAESSSSSAANLPPKPPRPSGTGANTLPLLPRAAKHEGAGGGNAAEIMLDEGSEEGNEGALEAADGKGDGVGAAPQYIDTSRSPVRTGGENAATTVPAPAFESSAEQPARGRGGGGQGGHGNRIWWEGYYDPSSNQNPWEFLEKARGLEPLGSWLPRGHGRNPGGGVRSG